MVLVRGAGPSLEGGERRKCLGTLPIFKKESGQSVTVLGIESGCVNADL